jgi:anaerobic magnesium-protoporphyrin IX monomethyl ester cyclase
MTDIALLFPPQWSPFQPPMSLPSLAAWLKREGFAVETLDVNIDFYHWLYSDACVASCRELLKRSAASTDEWLGYGAILEAAPDFRADIAKLHRVSRSGPIDDDAMIKAHFVAINSMEIFLGAISRLARDFTISPFSFEIPGIVYNVPALQRLVDNPPSLLSAFVDEYLVSEVAPRNPKSLGLSCIGQEQLIFTLLFGMRAKQLLGLPVIVGGTIFSRIFERGALPAEWVGRYFDVIVRNEGEKPCSALLENLVCGRALVQGVPGIVHFAGCDFIASAPCAPLKPGELPVPDFDDLPLDRYITGHLTLPLLSSRGCYWGKCEFCHHGMVYGEKYGAYEAETVLATIEHYAARHGVSHFAFNDEAIPPKIARRMGHIFPAAAETSWAFTGLIKFENFYEKEDFANLHHIGFRSLYVGLESASERVLTLMRKSNKQSTIARNLADATAAGIWMHCFLFFGFPGETAEDAQETYDFILGNEDIIGSFGCGVFSLEHNAPIFRHLEDFPVQLEPTSATSVNVYYDYRASAGLSFEQASRWADRLQEAARNSPKYFAASWVPREHLLSLLAGMTPERLIAAGEELEVTGGVPGSASTREVFSSRELDGEGRTLVAINRSNQRVFRIDGASAELFRLMYDADMPLAALRQQGPEFYDRLMRSPG